jgi:hypothetical protein
MPSLRRNKIHPASGPNAEALELAGVTSFRLASPGGLSDGNCQAELRRLIKYRQECKPILRALVKPLGQCAMLSVLQEHARLANFAPRGRGRPPMRPTMAANFRSR